MEVVAAIASIAGILSLIGQSLNGINILRGFFQNCASESHSIEKFLKRLNDLIQTLEHTSDLVTKIKTAPSKIVSESILASLQIQLEDCNKDVYRWLKTAETCLPASSTGTKAAFKRFLVVLEKQKMTDIYVEILTHKDNIMMKLSVIGRCFDINQSVTLETLCKRLKTWEDFEQSSHFAIKQNKDTIASSYDILSQPDSSSSLASIVESLARIENKIGDSLQSRRSLYSSQFGSDSSQNSTSASGRRGWSSEPSQYSAFTAARSHESMLASLPAKITQSLLGGRKDERLGSSSCRGSNQEQVPNCHDLSQHQPKDDCLAIHYEQSSQRLNGGFIQEATKYIDLILLAEAIIFKIKLFKTAPSTLFFTLSDQALDSEISSLEAQLHTIMSEAKALQANSWGKGFNTHDLDSHMARCRISGTRPRIKESTVQEGEKTQGATNAATTPKSGKLCLKPSMMNATQYDRINMWLLDNLEASNKEKKLHRSFLPRAASLSDEQWTRMVLKYWLLDDAATVPQDKCFSSNGAVDSDGMCHSERVLLDESCAC